MRRVARKRDRDAEHELMRLLDLTDQWWTGNSVLDRSAGPARPPTYIAHHDWHRCREVRNALTAALASRRSTP